MTETSETMAATTSAPTSPGGLHGSPAPASVREWMSYDRPAEFESVRTELMVPTRDGTMLSARLFRPGRDGQPVEGRFPGIVSDFTPYPIDQNALRHEYLSERGYNVLVCNVRGSGDSDGIFTSWFQAQEADDNYDVIEWLAEQPFSTGLIGQIGESYASITACRVAALQPPSLKAIAPIESPTDIYDWLYPGGVPTSNPAWWSGQGPVIDAEAHTSTLASFQDHPLFDDYWQQVVTKNKISAITVPALFVSGFYSIFKEGGFDALARRPEQTWVVYGPWTHAIPFTIPGKNQMVDLAALQSVLSTGLNLTDLGPAKSLSYSIFLGWFDHWLEARPAATTPPAKVISYEDCSKDGDGRWVAFDQWPPIATTTRLNPTSDGGLTVAVPQPSESAYAVDPFDGPSASLLGSSPADETRQQGFREARGTNSRDRYSGGRLTFTTQPFEKDTSVAGPVTLHLRAAITADDTYFVSKLETVLPDGRVSPLAVGSLRARLRRNRTELDTIVPGMSTEYDVALGNIHWRFLAGEQLRVTIGGGDFPRILPTAPAGMVTIQHGEQTCVDLPILHS